MIESAAAGDVQIHAAPNVDAWDEWNYARTDNLIDAISNRYVSAEVYGTDDLDHYGNWRVTPDYGSVWVPRGVAADWVPYSTGSWVWDPVYAWTWVDTAPWGWAPYHYGRWVLVNGLWAWAPGPRVVYPRYAPALVAFFHSGSGGIASNFGGPAVSWVALSWGEPCLPWWGRSGFVGRPWWGGWGGPRVVNNVVVQRNTVINNVTNITFRNTSQRNALIAMPASNFGQGPIAQARRLEPMRAKEWRPVAGRHPVQPLPISLAPTAAKAVVPAQEIVARPAVTARGTPPLAIAREPAPSESPASQDAAKQKDATPQSPAIRSVPWAPFGTSVGPQRREPRRLPDPPRVETRAAEAVPPTGAPRQTQKPIVQQEQQRASPAKVQSPPAQRMSVPPVQRLERGPSMNPVPVVVPREPRPPTPPVVPRQPLPPAPPREAQTTIPPLAPVITAPRLDGQFAPLRRTLPERHAQPPGNVMPQQIAPRLPGQPNPLQPRRMQREGEQPR